MLDLSKLNRHFAKTMPEIPHEYVVKGRDLSAKDWDDLANTIRMVGEPLAVSPSLGSVWFAIRHMRTKLRWKHSRPVSGPITPLTPDAELELLLRSHQQHVDRFSHVDQTS